jgi:hypothetical protein
MTVSQLTSQLTQEELTTWAAYFEIRSEEEEKAMERAKRQSQTGTMRSK